MKVLLAILLLGTLSMVMAINLSQFTCAQLGSYTWQQASTLTIAELQTLQPSQVSCVTVALAQWFVENHWYDLPAALQQALWVRSGNTQLRNSTNLLHRTRWLFSS
jgi:hypothetical protein